MSEYTYIRITREIAEKLKDMGKKSETYDQTLRRLLKIR